MCRCSQKKPLETPGYLSGNPWRPNALSLPCRCQGCVFRPLPQECWGHLPEPRHGGVIRHRVPAGQRSPRAPSRGGHRRENRPPILQPRWAEWEGNRRRSDGSVEGKLIADYDWFTFHFYCYFVRNSSCKQPLIEIFKKKYSRQICEFMSFCLNQRAGSCPIWYSNGTALPLQKRGGRNLEMKE